MRIIRKVLRVALGCYGPGSAIEARIGVLEDPLSAYSPLSAARLASHVHTPVLL